MKFSFAVVGLILIVQTICAAPIDVEKLTEPELRGILDSILSGAAGSILDAIVQALIDPELILPSTSTGQHLLNNTSGGVINSIVAIRNPRPPKVQKDDDLLDIINAIVEDTSSTGNPSDSTASQDEHIEDDLPNVNENKDETNDDDEVIPVLVVVV